MKSPNRLAILAFALATLSIVDSRITTVRAQGSLTPPGAPAPTMKTLDQMEPRTPIDAAHTPGNILAQYIITQPGSYYLTGNVAGVSGKRGIQIQTGNITLDLGGFALLGVPGASQGIYFPSGVTNVIIRNGIIAGWSGGINSPGFNGVFERLIVATNAGSGIILGDNCALRDCTISGNGQEGVFANGSGNLIINNLVAGNNTANSASYSGISVWGSRNRVEGNHVPGSGPAGRGILIADAPSSYTNNIVIRNTVVGAANNFSYNSSQVVGPLITVAPGGIITNSNPWANFSLP